jgi:hypothetical protein
LRGLVPVAREVFRGLDDRSAAAIVDSPERVQIRSELVFGPPDRMIRRKWLERVFLLGKDLLDQFREPLVKLGSAATGFRENDTTFFDVLPQALAGSRRKIGRAVAVKIDDRGLKQLGQGGDAGIEDLPGKQVFPVARDDADDIADVVRVVIPVLSPAKAQLVDQDGRAPLGEEQNRETGRQDLFRFVECAHPEASEFLLLVNELLGAQQVPIVPVKKADASQAADPLQAVEIIKLPLLAVAEILPNEEIAGEPIDSRLDVATGSAITTVTDVIAVKELLTLDVSASLLGFRDLDLGLFL